MHTRTQHEWVQLAIEHGLPIGPIYNGLVDVRNDPQVRSRGIFCETDHRDLGRVTYVGEPAIVRATL